MAPQLAWIGLGNMGRVSSTPPSLTDHRKVDFFQGMCTNLVEKGGLDEPLIIFNRTEKRSTDLQSKLPSGKSTIASSIDEAVARSDIIFTCLANDAAIQDTIESALKGNVKGKLFVDCSTVHPDITNKLAKSIEEHDAHFVACPGKGTYLLSIQP